MIDRWAAGGAGVAGGARRHGERGVVREDRALQLLQPRAGVEAELVGQRAPGLAQDVERLDVPPGSVQRQGEVRPQRLAQGILRDQGAELSHELGVARAGEVRLDPPLQRVQPHLVQPERLGHEQAALRDLAERGPAPERKRLGERLRRILGPAVRERGGAGRRALLEAVDVAAAARDVQHVGIAPCLDRVPPECAAQIRDVALDDVARRRRRGVAPRPRRSGGPPRPAGSR